MTTSSPQISPVHAECLEDFLSRLGPSAAVLDAAYGTGQYFGALVGRTSRLLCIDHSAAMLARAGEKHPDVEIATDVRLATVPRDAGTWQLSRSKGLVLAPAVAEN
ncbi:MAG: class I SAM-dependent methyltransferase [Acetobacteraceae bacterium]